MKLPFEEKERRRYFQLLNEVFDSGFWSEGLMVKRFEEKFSKSAGNPSSFNVSAFPGVVAPLSLNTSTILRKGLNMSSSSEGLTFILFEYITNDISCELNI